MYSKKEKIIMWLSSFDFMTYKKARYVIDTFFELEDFFDNMNNYKISMSKVFTQDEINQLRNNNNLVYIDRCISNYDKLGIKVVTMLSDDYPELLLQIDTSPIMLYCKGDISLLNSTCLGVVGTRRATKYGKTVGAQIIKDVAMENITIVSGLAEGIDTVAHNACLEVNGKTIAVLGGGILNIFPASNISLAEDIINKGGLIISEYKPNEPALTFHFPIRNRIIAGLSKGVFVVEATEKSGSMHTKNYAIEYNREVFALPARNNDIYSVGCNKIIKNGQAQMVLSSNDIIEFFGKDIKKNQHEDKFVNLTIEEQIIYENLLGQELHFDELSKATGLDIKNLTTLLMRLEIKGIINKLPGNHYELNKNN